MTHFQHLVADTLMRASIYKFTHAIPLLALVLIALVVWLAVYRRF